MSAKPDTFPAPFPVPDEKSLKQGKFAHGRRELGEAVCGKVQCIEMLEFGEGGERGGLALPQAVAPKAELRHTAGWGGGPKGKMSEFVCFRGPREFCVNFA